MANYAPQNSVWSAMDYKPPRGRCNHKNSIISSCPCLRFMLHPVKAATSFECDGCGHHASFHSLENLSEDAVLKKWSEQEAANPPTTSGAPRKRRRIAEQPNDGVELLELTEDDPDVAAVFQSNRTRTARKPRANAKAPATADIFSKSGPRRRKTVEIASSPTRG